MAVSFQSTVSEFGSKIDLSPCFGPGRENISSVSLRVLLRQAYTKNNIPLAHSGGADCPINSFLSEGPLKPFNLEKLNGRKWHFSLHTLAELALYLRPSICSAKSQSGDQASLTGRGPAPPQGGGVSSMHGLHTHDGLEWRPPLPKCFALFLRSQGNQLYVNALFEVDKVEGGE